MVNIHRHKASFKSIRAKSTAAGDRFVFSESHVLSQRQKTGLFSERVAPVSKDTKSCKRWSIGPLT